MKFNGKYVFYIQNYTTYLTANTLINQNGFKKEQIVFLFGRGFSPQDLIKETIDLTTYTINYKLDFWNNWRKIAQNKKKIKKIIIEKLGPKYIFIFPLTNLYFVRMISDHRNCVFKETLEDGVSAYWTKKERRRVFLMETFTDLIFSVKIFLNHYFSYFPISYVSYLRYYTFGFKQFYTLGEGGFLGYKNRVVLKPTNYKRPPDEFMGIDYLYAPAALVEKKIVSIETFIKSIKVLFSIIDKKKDRDEILKIHYRFHPLASNTKNMQCYEDEFNNFSSIEFIEIPKYIALEDILYHNDVVLISDISSLSVYAKTLGKEIIIYNEIISAFDPSFEKIINIQPKILKSIFKKHTIKAGEITEH